MTAFSSWKILFVVIPLMALALLFVAPAVVSMQGSVDPHLAVIAEELPACAPEPLEHVGYMIVTLCVPVIMFWWLAKNIDQWWQLKFSEPFLWEMIAQLGLGIFVALSLLVNDPYFAPEARPLNWLAVAALPPVMWAAWKTRHRFPWLWEGKWFLSALSVAVVLTIFEVSTDVFNVNALTHASPSILNHIFMTFGEIQAALCGRTMLVDFFPLHQNFGVYLFEPIFRVIGLNITSFTVIMAAVSAFSLLAIYFVFYLLTGRALFALLLYIPFLAFSFYSSTPAGPELLNNFNYWQVGPLRYYGFFVSLLLLAVYYRQPKPGWVFCISLVGALNALSSIDFGLCAFIAISAGLVFVDPDGNRSTWQRMRMVLLHILLAAVAALAIVTAFTYVRSGNLPRFDKVFEYLRVEERYGYYMLPLPDFTFYWLPYITWMSAIFIALKDLLSQSTQKNALLTALLLTTGVFGCGVAMYFVGRSHPLTLISLFPAWALSTVLIAWSATAVPSRWNQFDLQQRCTAAIPLALIVLGYSLCWSEVVRLPDPIGQWRRISSGPSVDRVVSFDQTDMPFQFVPILKRLTVGNEPVMIYYPFAGWLARQSGVENYFPFIGRNMILKSQLSFAMETIERRKIRKVFGLLPQEMQEDLAQAGFTKKAAFDVRGSAMPLSTPVCFSYWQRN